MTRLIWLAVALCLHTGSASAGPSKTVTGAQARDLMEALVATGLPLDGLTLDGKGGLVDGAGKQVDFHRGAIRITTARVQCDYYGGAPYPDEWRSAIDCRTADKDWKLGKVLANPLALAGQLERAGAAYDAHTGGRTLRVTSVSCTRDGASGTYRCQLGL